VCFGPAPVSVVTHDGALLIDARLDEGEAAARAGHLATHLSDGLIPSPTRGDDCAAYVDRALHAEARALALELRLRRAFAGPRRVTYEIEAPFWAAPAASREALIVDYLRAHPDGAPGIDALASGYARRCERAQIPASTSRP